MTTHLSRTGLPAGPRWPTFVQSLVFLAGRSYALPRWHRRYGDVFTVRLAPTGNCVVLSDPADIRQVFAGSAEVFHAGEGNRILAPIMGRHSVLMLDEAEHRAGRKRVMAAFHGETIAGFAQVIEQIAAADVERWPEGETFAVHDRMNRIGLDVILRIVFGVTDERRLAELRPLLTRVVTVGPVVVLGWLYPALLSHGPWRRFTADKAALDDAIFVEIARRREVADLARRPDVLSKLIVADPSQTDVELRDHLVTLLLAGHETTATTLAWTLHDLARDPALLARVRRAADERDTDFLDATIKESMRLRPVISSVARRLTRPVTIAGYDLPAGTTVFPAIDLVQRRADVYDEPDRFRPERFLGRNPPPATWIPFGGGLRRCLGAALATTEARAVLIAVLQRVDLAAVGRPEASRTRNVTTVPGRGARLIARRRRSEPDPNTAHAYREPGGVRVGPAAATGCRGS